MVLIFAVVVLRSPGVGAAAGECRLRPGALAYYQRVCDQTTTKLACEEELGGACEWEHPEHRVIFIAACIVLLVVMVLCKVYSSNQETEYTKFGLDSAMEVDPEEQALTLDWVCHTNGSRRFYRASNGARKTY